MRSALLAVGVAVLSISPGLRGQAVEDQLQGAWRVTQVERTGLNARVTDEPQPGLLLFAGRHYSYTFVTSDVSRPELRELPSAQEVLAVWGPFTANAGTFEVTDTTMIRRPVVAKSTGAMAPGAYNEYAFRLSADTLWITTVGTETGPARNPMTVRYLRER